MIFAIAMATYGLLWGTFNFWLGFYMGVKRFRKDMANGIDYRDFKI
jgi:hypothetical protein